MIVEQIMKIQIVHLEPPTTIKHGAMQPGLIIQHLMNGQMKMKVQIAQQTMHLHKVEKAQPIPVQTYVPYQHYT